MNTTRTSDAPPIRLQPAPVRLVEEQASPDYARLARWLGDRCLGSTWRTFISRRTSTTGHCAAFVQARLVE